MGQHHRGLKAVNTVLGNIKSAIGATVRSGSKKHAPRPRAEFEHPSTAAMIFPQWCPASAGPLFERRRRRIAC
jgi:hypothetical protein